MSQLRLQRLRPTQRNEAYAASSERPFDVPRHWEWAPFEVLSEITGGVTLGRKLAGKTTELFPYLRVANVQRGFLELGTIKEVAIPVEELERFRLHEDDLLITEGGDWDKVGRTAIWRGEILVCLHQNHVFRARLRDPELRPEWNELICSEIGRFLRLPLPPAAIVYAPDTQPQFWFASFDFNLTGNSLPPAIFIALHRPNTKSGTIALRFYNRIKLSVGN